MNQELLEYPWGILWVSLGSLGFPGVHRIMSMVNFLQKYSNFVNKCIITLSKFLKSEYSVIKVSMGPLVLKDMLSIIRLT